MKKIHDKDKAGISTGTTKIEKLDQHPGEMKSKGKNQKPAGPKAHKVSRGQTLK